MNLTALVTPFKKNKSLDLDNFQHLVLQQACCDGVVLAGTTGEGRSLEFDEKIKLVEIVKKIKNKGQLPLNFKIVLSVNDIEELAKVSSITTQIEILLTPPPYYKPSQNDIIDFYNQCVNQSPYSIIIYNNPSRVGVDISCNTLNTLMSNPGISAVKESNTDFLKVMTLVARHPTTPILCGEDSYVGVFYACGAKGWISVIGNILPNFCQGLHTHYVKKVTSQTTKNTRYDIEIS